MEQPPDQAIFAGDAARMKMLREKPDVFHDLSKVVPLDDDARRTGGISPALPSLRAVDALLRAIPRGKLATFESFRAAISRAHGAVAERPGATRKVLRIAAHAAAEAFAAGESDVTPYWRIVRATGNLIGNLPGGTASLATLLEAEGHAIERRGQRVFVKDFMRSLVSL